MAKKGMKDDRRRQRQAERRRHQQPHRTPADAPSSGRVDADRDASSRRAAAAACAWCGRPITPRSRGPIPKWCSATCRHRAWEQKRAAVSGRSAVEVVERRIEVPTRRLPTRQDWPGVLQELARQLGEGRIYDRDMQALSDALAVVLAAFDRRPHVRQGRLAREPLAHAGRQGRGGSNQQRADGERDP